MKNRIIPLPVHLETCSSHNLNLNKNINVHDKKNDSFTENLDNFQKKCFYEIIITAQKIDIYTFDQQGTFYAMKSLEALTYGHRELQCQTIVDWPKYSHRGFMLDVARHFTPVDKIKKLLDITSKLKLNVFHWHLTDDQGWRIYIDKYPKLVTTCTDEDDSELQRNGFYTKAELKEIVLYANERFITIIPEIDMPGHITSAISAYPTLSCKGENVPIPGKAGIYDTILCLGKSETMEFVYGVLDEIIEIFPGEKIHIGGDEVLKTNWLTCPNCKKLAKDNGYTSATELHNNFTKDIVNYLSSKGKKTILWNDAFIDNDLDNTVTCQFWNDGKKNENVSRAIKNGHDLIYSNFMDYYFDYPLSFTSLRKVYEHNPEDTLPSIEIKGIECALWTELVKTEKTMDTLLFPRLFAFSQSAWSGANRDSYDKFTECLDNSRDYFSSFNIDIGNRSNWEIKGLKAFISTYKHYKKMLSFKTIKAVLKMKKDTEFIY